MSVPLGWVHQGPWTRHTPLPDLGPGMPNPLSPRRDLGLGIPHLVDRHTPVKTLPSCNFVWRAVTIIRDLSRVHVFQADSRMSWRSWKIVYFGLHHYKTICGSVRAEFSLCRNRHIIQVFPVLYFQNSAYHTQTLTHTHTHTKTDRQTHTHTVY